MQKSCPAFLPDSLIWFLQSVVHTQSEIFVDDKVVFEIFLALFLVKHREILLIMRLQLTQQSVQLTDFGHGLDQITGKIVVLHNKIPPEISV